MLSLFFFCLGFLSKSLSFLLSAMSGYLVLDISDAGEQPECHDTCRYRLHSSLSWRRYASLVLALEIVFPRGSVSCHVRASSPLHSFFSL